MKKKISAELNKLIPGGCHTYSKADNQFPYNAPEAIVSGKGCYVLGTDKKKYLDCGMGLSSVSIGHANKEINKKVKNEIDKGCNFNRPSILELKVAKKFLSVVPKHNMIKFAKNGSTVTTAAVKLARAFTGRDFVAFPKQHFFYSYDDWFMSRQPTNSGIPISIGKKTLTFNECNLSSLKKLFSKYKNKIACVIMEPEKNYCNCYCACNLKVSDYLRQAQDIIHENGSLFITDEMVTGYKTSFPGSTTKYNLDADLTTWGKGIANGFSFCALTGKKKIMELGDLRQKKRPRVFLISSTHGAESGPLAAFEATFDFFKNKKVIKKNKKFLKRIVIKTDKLIKKYSLSNNIEIIKSQWLVSFIFLINKKVSNEFKTIFMQEMIKNNVLFQGFVIPSYSHGESEVKKFCNAFEEALKISSKVLENGIKKYLIQKPVKPIFTKFNM